MDVTNYKDGVETDVTDKTAPRSIPATVVGGKLTDLADLTADAVNELGSDLAATTALAQKSAALPITIDNFLNPATYQSGVAIGGDGALITGLPSYYKIARVSGLTPGQSYYLSGDMAAPSLARLRAVDASGAYLAGSVHDAATDGVSGSLPWHFTVPNLIGYAYLDISVAVANAPSTSMMISPDAGATYKPYGASVSEANVNLPSYDTAAQAALKFVQANNLSKNKLNINQDAPGTNDMLVIGAGIGPSPAYAIVTVGDPAYSYAKIPTTPGVAYTFSGTLDGAAFCRIRFEDANGNFIGGFDPAATGISALPFNFTPPAGSAFSLLSTRAGSTSDYGTLMVRLATDAAGYVPYYKAIPAEVIPPEFAKKTDVIGRWLGKTILYIGDSQIAFNLWPPKAAAIMGNSNLINGVAGSCVTPGFGVVPTQSLCSAARLATIVGLAATADLIVIASGGNDSIQNVPLGTATDAGIAAATTFGSAVNYVLEYLQANATTKSKRLVWLGVLWTHGTFADRQDQYNHTLLYDDLNRLCCERHGVPYLSTLKKSGITRENETVYQSDGTHLNDLGADVYAAMAAGFLNAI